MTRFMLLDRGEELSEANYRGLGSASQRVRVKLLDPAPPFRGGQVVQVTPRGPSATRSRALLLCRGGGGFCLFPRGSARGEVLGQVVAIERGPTVFSLERGLLRLVPARWLPRAIDALEVLGKFRHPFTPSLRLGSADACLEGVREKYNGQGEVHEYSRLAEAGLEAFEREIVERHFKPEGRLLDIGCGAGREALGFARVGFRVVAIDIAPRMIEAARRQAEREGLAITFRVQSVTELDEPPASFDGAYFVGSYYHIPGRPLRVETLRRLGTALTPDGVLILTVVYRGVRGFLFPKPRGGSSPEKGRKALPDVAALRARGPAYS